MHSQSPGFVSARTGALASKKLTAITIPLRRTLLTLWRDLLGAGQHGQLDVVLQRLGVMLFKVGCLAAI